MRLILAGIAALALTGSLSAQTIAWNFTDLNGTFDTGTPVNWTVSGITIGNSFGNVTTPINGQSVSSGYTTASGTGNIGNANNTAGFSLSSPYYEFTITPDSGFALSLNDLDFGARSTGTGAQAYSIRWSFDSFGTEIAGGSIANNSTWSFKDNSFASLTAPVDTPVTVRIYAYGGTGSPSSGTINNRLDDIALNVTATSAIPEPAGAALMGLSGMGVVFMRRRKVA